MIQKSLSPTVRRSGEEWEIDRPGPRALDNYYAKRAEHVASSRRLDAETHCGSRNADSQGFRTGRIVEIGQINITNESVMAGNSCTPVDAQKTQSRGILAIQDYKQC